MSDPQSMPAERMVTVCSACLCASCWHGEFMCWDAPGAGTVEKSVSELRRLDLGHPRHYSVKKIREVSGT